MLLSALMELVGLTAILWILMIVVYFNEFGLSYIHSHIINGLGSNDVGRNKLDMLSIIRLP